MEKRAAEPARIEPSSGNIFADLGVRDAFELDIKVRLAAEINRLLKYRRLRQVTAAARLEVSPPKILALKNYELDGFSIASLMAFLLALGRDVEIRIAPGRVRRARGRIVVRVA